MFYLGAFLALTPACELISIPHLCVWMSALKQPSTVVLYSKMSRYIDKLSSLSVDEQTAQYNCHYILFWSSVIMQRTYHMLPSEKNEVTTLLHLDFTMSWNVPLLPWLSWAVISYAPGNSQSHVSPLDWNQSTGIFSARSSCSCMNDATTFSDLLHSPEMKTEIKHSNSCLTVSCAGFSHTWLVVKDALPRLTLRVGCEGKVI